MNTTVDEAKERCGNGDDDKEKQDAAKILPEAVDEMHWRCK